jgi:hypothetical protein
MYKNAARRKGGIFVLNVLENDYGNIPNSA